jgi:hypothetical protein
MTRLGDWNPETPAARLDRMESLAMIRQLAVRYALAVDARALDDLVALFVPDVRVGRDASGRDALKVWYERALSGHRASVHFVANHIISFDDADHARGVVYCHDELERPTVQEWHVGMLQYWDTYLRVDGEWCFLRRRFHRWYIDDVLRRPAIGAGVGNDGLTTALLPDAFENLAAFWQA